MYSGPERRSGSRVPFSGKAIVYVADRQVPCEAVNLSASGMLLLPPARAGAGLQMRLSFIFEGMKDWITVGATIVREGDYEGRYAWGVRFDQIAPYVSTMLRSYVRQQERGGPAPEPQMSEAAQPLIATEQPQQGSSPIQRVSTGPIARRSTGPHQIAVPQPQPDPLVQEPPSEETDPFADLPTSGESFEDVHETDASVEAARRESEEDSDSELWGQNVNLHRLYKDALDDMKAAEKPKKKKGWFRKG